MFCFGKVQSSEMAPGLLMFAIERIKSESPMSNPLSNIPKLHAVVDCFLSSKFANFPPC